VLFRSPAILQGDVWVGYRSFHSPTSGAADFHGAVAYGTLVFAPPSGAAVSLRLQRDIEFSFDKSLAYYVSTSVNVTASLPLSNLWRLQGFGATTTLDYRPAGSTLPGPLQRVNEFGGAIGFNLGAVTVVGVSTEWAQAIGAQGWKELRVVAFLTYGSAHGAYQRLDRPIPFSR
jgi:hypothetical protein